MPPDLEEKYQVLRLLEKDTTGGIYLAEDVLLQREVAMRRYYSDSGELISEVGKQRSQETIQRLVALQHPHILPLLDAGIDEDGAYTISPLLKGRMLTERVTQAAFSEAEARQMATQVLGALSHAHASGFVHGSLNPGSLFVNEASGNALQCTLIDLGCESIAADILGTIATPHPLFQSPDQLQNTPATPASDCYQLGHILYYCLLGAHPWAGLKNGEIQQHHQHCPLPPLSNYREGISEAFQSWLDTLTENSLTRRYPDAPSALEALQSLKKAKPQRQLTSSRAVSKGALRTLITLFIVTSATALYSLLSSDKDEIPAITTAKTAAIFSPIQTPIAPPDIEEILTHPDVHEERIHCVHSLTQHPRSACALSHAHTLDWAVFTALETSSTCSHANGSIIGDARCLHSAAPQSSPVGNLIFFNERGETFRPSLFAQCQEAGDGFLIPLHIPANHSEPLKVTIHFSSWNCDAAVSIDTDESLPPAAPFIFQEKQSFASHAVRYTITPNEQGSALNLRLTAQQPLQADKGFGLSLNAIIID